MTFEEYMKRPDVWRLEYYTFPDMRAAYEAGRAAGIEEAARKAKTAWLECPYGSIADADAMNDMCEWLNAEILALKTEAGR